MPKKYDFQKIKDIAQEKGGVCLEDEYKNSYTKMKFKCEIGHIWETTARSIVLGYWCKDCNNKYNLEDMKKIAKIKNGECLSTSYKNTISKLKWKCQSGHIFEKEPSKVMQGKWCPDCGGTKRLTIELVHEIARRKNGKCLSTEYKNNRTKLLWECEHGHQFEAKANSIKDSNTWCPECAGTKKLSIERMREEARNRGGECLSEEYINSGKNLIWKCAEGHIWEDKYDHIRNGRWCPRCNNRLFNENKVKFIFEHIFNKNFPKNRKVLGDEYEIDGYNEELKIGFEYQGEQHYKFIDFFHGSEEGFKKSVDDDALKLKLAKEKNIILVVIPYTESVTDERKFDFIIKKLKSNGVKVNKKFEDIPFKKFYETLDQLNEAIKIAEERNGKCLSTKFIDSQTKLNWECEHGHQWKQSLTIIKFGSWCNVCNGTPKKTVADMIKLAKNYNGKFLSNEYKGINIKHRWECNKGHVFERTPTRIQNGIWCSDCKKNKREVYRLSIEDLHKTAAEKNGYCLSTKYVNKDTKYKWECENGHIWEATFGSVRNSGTWCKECSIENKRSSFSEKNDQSQKRTEKLHILKNQLGIKTVAEAKKIGVIKMRKMIILNGEVPKA